jgi:hypothetical protein
LKIETPIRAYLADSHPFFKPEDRLVFNCSCPRITPAILESVSRVRNRARLSKVDNKKLRNLVFLCSFYVCKHNKGCRELYEGIIAKGKSKKLALVAIANKLLKPYFAFFKSKIDQFTLYLPRENSAEV